MSRRRLMSIVLLAALMMLPAQTALADYWGGYRTCDVSPFEESLRVKSYASTGTVGHYRNEVLKASWWNSSSIWRTSWHGNNGGAIQLAEILTGGTLSSQSAVCICVDSYCPNR